MPQIIVDPNTGEEISVSSTFRCRLPNNEDGDPVYSDVTWRFFYAQCPKTNQLCNSTSGAFLSAVTVCGQRLL